MSCLVELDYDTLERKEDNDDVESFLFAKKTFPTSRSELESNVDNIMEELSKSYTCTKLDNMHDNGNTQWLMKVDVGYIDELNYKILLCYGTYNIFNMFEESPISINRTSTRRNTKKVFLLIENGVSYVGDPLVCRNEDMVITHVHNLYRSMHDRTYFSNFHRDTMDVDQVGVLPVLKRKKSVGFVE